MIVVRGVGPPCDGQRDHAQWFSRKGDSHTTLVAVPYSLELNDSVIYAVEHHSSAEIYQRVVDTLHTYDAEDAAQPVVLSLPIHPHLIGAPHRLPYFARILELLAQREDTIFLSGSGICDWFAAQASKPNTPTTTGPGG